MTIIQPTKAKSCTPTSTLSRSYFTLSTTPDPTSHLAWTANHTAYLDSGAEVSVFRSSPLSPPTGPSNTIIVLPNGEKAQPLGTRSHSVAGLPITAHIFNETDIRNSLVSAHYICAQKHSILLEDTGATIMDPSGRPILHAPKPPHSRLWPIPIMDSHHHQSPKQNAVPLQSTAATNSIISSSTHAEKTA